jgi:hypothetical protein
MHRPDLSSSVQICALPFCLRGSPRGLHFPSKVRTPSLLTFHNPGIFQPDGFSGWRTLFAIHARHEQIVSSVACSSASLPRQFMRAVLPRAYGKRRKPYRASGALRSNTVEHEARKVRGHSGSRPSMTWHYLSRLWRPYPGSLRGMGRSLEGMARRVNAQLYSAPGKG